MAKTINAIWINAEHEQITDVEIPDTLEAFQAGVGGRIELAARIKNCDFYVNETASFSDQIDYGFNIDGGPCAIIGNGLIVGAPIQRGRLTAKDIRPLVEFAPRALIELSRRAQCGARS